ncbi:MAG: hypothetical protein R3D00_20810 [Bacteroidia bacterium]
MKQQYLLIFLLLFQAVLFAQNSPTRILATMPLIQSNPDAVIEGMGGLGVVLPGNLMGNHSRMNPALLHGPDDATSFQIHYYPQFSRVFSGFNQIEGNLNFSIRPRHRMSVILGGFNTGIRSGFTVTCPLSRPLFTSALSGKVGIQYSWKINDWLTAGVGFSALRSNFNWICEDNNHVTHALSGQWGLQFQKPIYQSGLQQLWLRAAVSQTGLGPSIDFFPIDTGMAVIGPINRAGVLLDWEKNEGVFSALSLGYQISYIPGYTHVHSIGLQESFRFGEDMRFFLRQGLTYRERMDPGRNPTYQITTGIGFQAGFFRMDASVLTPLIQDIGVRNRLRLSMTYSFGE